MNNQDVLPSNIDPLPHATARNLNLGAIHLLRGLRAIDRQSGLTPARLSALSVLVFGGPRSVGRLAQAEDVASPTMSRIVDGLCDLGLVMRTPHPDNARMAIVSATSEGEHLMQAAAERRLEAITEAMALLDASEQAALEQAAPALRYLAAILRDGLSDG